MVQLLLQSLLIGGSATTSFGSVYVEFNMGTEIQIGIWRYVRSLKTSSVGRVYESLIK